MTRINANLPVENLTDEHLLAEHREIKRVCNRFKERIKSNKFEDIPNNFKLNKGHELFFSIRPRYTYTRYFEIYRECLIRKFKVQDYSLNWSIYNEVKCECITKEYTPTMKDKEIIIERITERIKNSKKDVFHYYGKIINKEQAIEILNQ